MPRKTKASDKVKRDKVDSAIHEAGHAVVALKLGAPWARITQTRDPTRKLDTEVAFISQCHAMPPSATVPKAAQGFAGIIAESLYHERLDVDVDSLLDQIYYKVIEPSPTDWAMIGTLSPEEEREAIAQALEILKTHWEAVQGIGWLLHENHRGDVTVLAEELKAKNWAGLL